MSKSKQDFQHKLFKINSLFLLILPIFYSILPLPVLAEETSVVSPVAMNAKARVDSTSPSHGMSKKTEELSPVAIKTKAIVDSVYAFVSTHSDDMSAVQEALQTDPRFSDHDEDLYIFMHCYDATKEEAICCGQGARPEFLGKNMWYLRTPNGRLLFHEFEQIITKDGKGWLEYEWLNPFTKKIQTKRSYLRGIVLKDGRNAWVGCGFWKEK